MVAWIWGAKGGSPTQVSKLLFEDGPKWGSLTQLDRWVDRHKFDISLIGSLVSITIEPLKPIGLKEIEEAAGRWWYCTILHHPKCIQVGHIILAEGREWWRKNEIHMEHTEHGNKSLPVLANRVLRVKKITRNSGATISVPEHPTWSRRLVPHQAMFSLSNWPTLVMSWLWHLCQLCSWGAVLSGGTPGDSTESLAPVTKMRPSSAKLLLFTWRRVHLCGTSTKMYVCIYIY